MTEQPTQPASGAWSSDPGPGPGHASPVTSLDDPRAVQVLSTEHWSLLATRSLVYNEAFTRGGMFLAFLSTSFVGLALLAQAMSFDQRFLTVAAVVLGFDLVIGLTTFGRIAGANADDLRAVHGMARIRHGYSRIAPVAMPFFTTATHDDLASVLTAYGSGSSGWLDDILYGLTTSGGMIGLITSMLGGVFAAVLSLSVGLDGVMAVWIGVAGAALVFGVLLALTFRGVPRQQAALGVLFPAPEPGSSSASAQQETP